MSRRKCPTKWKQAHPDKASAVAHLDSLRGPSRRVQHVYLCPNGEHWHVGSKKAYNYRGRYKS